MEGDGDSERRSHRTIEVRLDIEVMDWLQLSHNLLNVEITFDSDVERQSRMLSELL